MAIDIVAANHPGEFTDADAVNQITHSFPLSSGSNRKVMVGISAEDAGAGHGVTTGCTFNGVAMTKIADLEESTLFLDVYEILEADLPAGGSSYDIVASFADTVDKSSIVALELTGADQNAFDAVQEHAENSGTATQTVEITTLVDGSMVIVFGANTGGSVTAEPEASDYTATEREQHNATGHSIYMSSGPVATAGTVTAGLTWSAAGGMCLIAVAQAPAAAATANPWYHHLHQQMQRTWEKRSRIFVPTYPNLIPVPGR